MTKAEIVANISEKSGIEKADVLRVVEDLMKEVKPAKIFVEGVKKNVPVK